MTDMPPPATPTPVAPPARRRGATRSEKLRLVFGLGAMLVFLAVVLYATRNNQTVDDLAVGACFDEPTRSSDISTVTHHDCTEPHDAEVFQVAEFTDAKSYPISLTLDSFIDTACVPVLKTYAGASVATSNDFTIGYFYPSRDGWDKGDRTVTCYVDRADNAKLTKSLKGTGGS